VNELLDWLLIFALFFSVTFIGLLALLAIVFAFSKSQPGPRRIVDVENRGHTRILLPDGTIK
jgi:hypothetical protein